jgi:choline dehydrogenase-like flavoprotein
MAPMKTFRHGEVWRKGCEAVGIRLVSAAVGMNSTDYKGRPACIYDGWCHVGCPTGALSNPLVTYLGDARKAGAEVRARSTVTRVLTNPQGNKATAVEYYDANKERQVQEASVVVLAAWSAQNPRIMLNSATDKHPKGLANASGLLGKYMMAHFSSGTWASSNNHRGEALLYLLSSAPPRTRRDPAGRRWPSFRQRAADAAYQPHARKPALQHLRIANAVLATVAEIPCFLEKIPCSGKKIPCSVEQGIRL